MSRNNKVSSFYVLCMVSSILLIVLSLWCFWHTIRWVIPVNIAKYMLLGIVSSLAAILLIKRARLFSSIPAYALILLLLLRLILALYTEIHMRYSGTLYDAIHTGNAEVVQRRIDSGCNVNETIGGDPLICHVFQIYSYRDRYEPAPSKEVCDKQIVEILKVLIDNGANLNALDDYRQWPALFWAVVRRNTAAVRLLVEKGADVNLRDKDGYSALHFAQTPVSTQILVDNGADVNANANDGNTPLHMIPIVENSKILISRGADVNAKNKAGETPLDLAVREGYEDLAELLRKSGAEQGG